MFCWLWCWEFCGHDEFVLRKDYCQMELSCIKVLQAVVGLWGFGVHTEKDPGELLWAGETDSWMLEVIPGISGKCA